ncbi:acyltransferase family protein [Massilia sp. LXY-6]|uniref:acyltransferase family protein n=1 Tax=Massilia sp. LXY-6 TaxID=3379823 RepID=UPI003EE12A4A
MSTREMRGPARPRLAFQRKSQLGDDYWHSVLISLLRGAAAIIVAAAHVRAAMYPGLRTIAEPTLSFQGLAFVTGFAHQAVLVFFIISGWLVGGSLLNKLDKPGAFLDYTIDRMTRLWTVLIPTFILTLLCGLAIGAVDAGTVDYSATNEYSALVFLGNLVGLQRVLLPDFGGDFPLWSLANETWYYVLFPLLTLLFAARAHMARAAAASAVLLIVAVLPVAITAYFLIWLLGVAFSRVRIECSPALRLVWLGLLFVVAGYFRLTGTLDDFSIDTLWQDLACSLMFLVFLSSLQFRAAPSSTLLRPLANGGRFFAEFSFSLYVLHVPLIALLAHWSATYLGLRQLSPHQPLHLAIYFGILAICQVAAYLSYRLFESQTYHIRRIVKQWVASARRASQYRTG